MTFVGVEAGAGRARLELRGGNIAPRVIRVDALGATVALVATQALLLGGDHVELELRVGPGAWLEIVETAGTVAYDSAGQSSTWCVSASVEKGGLLLWHGEPFVVAAGANTLRHSTIDLHDDARACLRETIVLGRTGEIGGGVRIRNLVRQDNFSALVEDLDLGDRQTRELPGIMGSARVLDTVTRLGHAAPSDLELTAGTVFELDRCAGTLARVLRSGLAGSPAGQWWSTWSREVRAGYLAARS